MAGAPETGAECHPSMVQKCQLSLLLKTHRSLSCTEKVGPLTIYRMALKHVKHQKMWEFGTANVEKKNKVIMMVGETGSGKTSLINTMVNYIFGVDWKDDYRIQLIEESSEKSQAHSQTSSVTIYQINHEYYFRIPYTITIIDTPGFGDTKNVKQNEKIMRKMREFFHKCKFTEIDAICFVVPSTLARLTPTQMNIYDNILSIFGNDIKDNIVFFTTFADVQEPIVLSAITETGVLCAKSEDGKPVYFKVNNSMVYANNCPDGVDDYVYNTDEGQWKMGMESTRKFFLHFLSGITSKDFSSTKDVLAERNALEVTLDGLVQKIELVTRKHHELEQTERALNKHKAEIEQNEHFEFEVLKTAKRKINSFVYSTNCQECNFTCHQDCLMYFDPSVCSCEVFSLKGTCSVCGHSSSKHVSENVYWQTFVEPKKKSYFAVKEKYEKVENKVMTPSNVFIKLKNDVNKSEVEVLKLIQEVAKILKRPKEITLKPNPTSAVDYIRLLIEKENKEGTSGFVERIQRLEEAIKIFDNQSQKAGAECRPSMVENCKLSLLLKTHRSLSCTEKVGPLTIYRMALKHVKHQKMWEFGTANVDKKNKVIMMVGETGSGKTSLINTMVNYIFGVDWKDDYRIQLIEESSEKSQAHSQTSSITIYQINHEYYFRIPYTITIIDTPGFGDTKNVKQNEKIMWKMQEFFHKCKFTEIDAICFVVPSTLARLTPTQMYIYDNILSIFGNDIKDNIVFFTTFADVQEPIVLTAITETGVLCAKSEDGKPVYFKVNNSMVYANNCPDGVDDDVYNTDEGQWKMGMESTRKFFLHFLSGITSKDFSSTKDVLAERNALEVTLDGLVQKIELVTRKHHELEQTERALNKHKAEIEQNEHFEFEVLKTAKRKINSFVYSTNCQECNFTCHQDCLMYFDPSVCSCEVFSLKGTCSVCGHSSSKHVSENVYWQTFVEPKKKSYFAVKEKYEKVENKVMTPSNVFIKLKDDVNKSEVEVLKLIQEVAKILKRPKEITLKPNPTSAVDYIRLLIEKENKEGTSGFVERIQRLEDAIKIFDNQSQKAGAECRPSMVENCKLSLLLKTHRSLSCTEKVGPLTIYRMALKHVKHQKMWEFGTANVDKKNKVIMMVGETGSGKTSLINTMVNYIFGVDWKDDYRIQLIEESSEKSQAHSQTSSITIYQINHEYYFRIPYTITIIDTPGFGDTKNVKQNEKIMWKMQEFFHKCKFTEIDAICFVVPSTLARLTPTQMYIYDNILSIFGNDIKDNIVFFTTFADVQEPIVLSAITETGVLCAKSEDGKPVYFKVNNSMVYANNCPDGVDDYVYNTDEGQWKMGMESTRKFLLHFLPGITSKDFSSTKDVLAERNALEVTLDGLVQKIELVTRKHHELEQTERALNKHKAEIEQNEHFEFEVLKTAKRKINSFVYSTNCQECNFTCHQDCLMYFDPSVCFCEVFSLKGTCSVCGHNFSKHVSENVYWQTFVEPKKKSYFAVKEKYEKVENKVMTPSNVFIKLKDDVNKSEFEVLKLIQEVAKILKRLKEITLKPNPTSAVDYIRLLIEKENKEGTSGIVERIQRLEEAIKIFDNQTQKAGTEGHPTMVDDPGKSLPPNLVNCTSSTSKAGPLTIYRVSLDPVKANRKNKVIMMVGETGSGKSTLINAMINYIFGVEWRDDRRFQVTGAHNQTSNVSIYQINHEDGFRIPYSITFIDTLGFGDTRGIEHDEKIMRKIREFFYKCKFTEIDAICFVVQSSLTRLTPTQAYIFDNLLSIFGNDIKNNIVFFTTFADDQKPSVLSAITKAKIPCALSEDGLPVHFKVNNCMLYANNRPDEVDAQVYEAYERQWKMGMKSIEQFLLVFLPGKASKNLRLTRNVLAERNALEVTLDGLVQKLEELMFKQHELQQTERALNKHKAEIEKNEHFAFELWGTVKIKKYSSEYSTNCHKCNSTCHQDCLVYFDTFVYFCEAFNLIGTCRVCGHGSSRHFSEKFYWQTIVLPIRRTFFALKKIYEEEEKKVMTLENVLQKFKSEIRKAEDEALKLIQEVARILEHLQKIALKPNPVPAVDYIRLLIEKEKREGKSGFMERIELLEKAITNFVANSNIQPQGAGARSNNGLSAVMSYAGQPRS